MTGWEYFNAVRDAVKECNEAYFVRMYGRPHQTGLGRSSDVSDPTSQRYTELAEADAVIDACSPIIQEAECVIAGLRKIMTSNAKIADVLELRYLELMQPREIAERLGISKVWERKLHQIGLQMFDNLGKAFLYEKGLKD